MFDVLLSGKLLKDPINRQTKNGNPFATAFIRVSIDAEQSVFVSLIAFNDLGEKLGRLKIGDSVCPSAHHQASVQASTLTGVLPDGEGLPIFQPRPPSRACRPARPSRSGDLDTTSRAHPRARPLLSDRKRGPSPSPARCWPSRSDLTLMGMAGTSTNATTKGKPIAKRPATFWPEPRASPLPSDRLRSGRNLERHERPARAFPISG